MTGSTVSGNSAGDGGGGAWIGAEGGTDGLDFLTITGSTISGNTTDDGGGGLYTHFVAGALTITDSTISGNTAAGGRGGGAYVQYFTGSIAITGTTISGNTATSGGGGAWIGYVGGNIDVTNSTISGNTSDSWGGALYVTGAYGVTTLAFTTIAGNSAAASGGGIEWYENGYEADGDLVIRNSTISGNTADGDAGGIYFSASNYGALEISNSTISGNTAADDGGGIWFAGYYGALVIQTTITDNTAEDGAGIYIGAEPGDMDAGGAEAHAADRAARRAEKDAEITAKGGTPRVRQQAGERVRAAAFEAPSLIGTIVVGNHGPDIADVGEVEAMNSLLGTLSGTTLVDLGGNQLGVDPLLGPLADNGGPTQTHALLPGSPAIDTGPNPLVAFPGDEYDQRGAGYDRVVAGIVDIGAYEVQPIIVTPTFTG